ncbi:Netrin receptor DCC, partial [Fasciola gigantica]
LELTSYSSLWDSRRSPTLATQTSSICCAGLNHGRGCLFIGSSRISFEGSNSQKDRSSNESHEHMTIEPFRSEHNPDGGATSTAGNLRELSTPKLRRKKRMVSNQLAESYASIDHRLLPPRNLQIVPIRFGTFNISWIPAAKNEPWISHFELVMISLGEVADKEEDDRCKVYRNNFNLSDREPSTFDRTPNQGQLTLNVSAPASWTVVTGLPPDNFYRVLLFSMAGTQRSPPASMPSSPRVPALAPRSAPRDVKITTRGVQSAKVAWELPDGFDCTGELINYVITINSSRLLEPIVIKVPREKRSYVVEDLVPGTQYTVQVAATTRGGVGVASSPLNFRTSGETPRVDMDDDTEDVEAASLVSEEPEEWDEFYEGIISRSEWTGDERAGYEDPRMFMVPAKIHNLRATATQSSIHLKWTVALRRVNPDTERELLVPGPRNSVPRGSSEVSAHPMRINLAINKHDKDSRGYLPSGTKYLIRWGDMHPGPAEDSVRGDQTEYLIENLRPGTIYYIRVIAVTQLGEGPAAYTVTRTLNPVTDELTPATSGPLIPVNLVVQAVGSTWARVGWELSNLPSAETMPSLMFQIKYYAITADGFHDTQHGYRRGLSTYERDVELVNLTVPNRNRGAKRVGSHYKAMLRGLRPGTQYEFGVCLIQSHLTNDLNAVEVRDNRASAMATSPYCWSMVQGFETFGQHPKDPPQRIRVLIPLSDTKPETIGLVQLDPSDSGGLSSDGGKTYPIRVIWDSPSQSNGPILAYVIYLTANRKQSVTHWFERSVDGSLRRVEIRGLDLNRVYYMQIAARNRHGRSPLSSVIVFRTPDAQGIGGGMFKLSREYYDARDINEPLMTMVTGISEALGTQTADLKGENMPWIVVGSVLGGALVIMIVITVVLLNRCRRGRTSLGLMKGAVNFQPVNGPRISFICNPDMESNEWLNHGLTGSGSLNDDEAITSSPASSSAGRASGGMAHLPTSQTHGNAHIRKFPQSQLQGFGKSDIDKVHGGISPQRLGVFPSTVQMTYDGRGKQTKTSEYKMGRPLQSNVTTGMLNDISPTIQQKHRTGNFGNPTRVNVMSSDYASQQSSLSESFFLFVPLKLYIQFDTCSSREFLCQMTLVTYMIPKHIERKVLPDAH